MAKVRKKRKRNAESARQTKRFFLITAAIVGVILFLMYLVFSRI
ncbi:lipopolysaccharide/colanic/teichoic acid biosynthesis glycosyltransferase [Lewinella aquimaris]|uniref:Lipopolysaccharide/colanic/teichoic acid biosynthesis glycosyltransferase n=1 Tax=Neolewinella aquimaris TaxID=1835722 RepID=A0A840E1Q6_9BACT|nr:hypothetical protein [Neolewinella aquimaris]MBB4079151.1 lipopolysaccharide/colanic/teichoic acid biosynthesis glycosyltransferase [Neolewinella aquimaris]